MTHYKLGIAPINWTNDDDPNLGGEISFEQCIEEMAQAGYSGCEIGNRFPQTPEVLKQHLSPLGLEISSAWYGTTFTEADNHEDSLAGFLEKLSFLSHMGSSYINVCEVGGAIHSMDTPLFKGQRPTFSEQQWECLIQGLHQLGRLAYDYGMTVVYHHHLGTGVQNQKEIDTLMKYTCPDLISLLVDTGHCAAADIDAAELIAQYATRIKYVHLKDVRKDILTQITASEACFMDCVRAGLFTVPGDGSLPFEKIFDVLKAIDYRGWMIVEAEQDPAKANPKEYALYARKFIKKHMGE